MNKAKGKNIAPSNTTTPKNTSNKFMSGMDKVRTNPIKGPAITTYTPEEEETTQEVAPKKSNFLPNIGKSLNSGVGNFNKAIINVADDYFKAVNHIPGINTSSQQEWLQKRREDNDRVMVEPNKVDETNASLPEKAAYMLARSAVDLLPANIIGKASGAVKVGKLAESAIANKLGGKLGQYAGNAAKEGIENTAYGVAADTFNKESKEDMLKNAGTNFIGGAGVGTILKGAGDLLPKWKKTELPKVENTPVNKPVEAPKVEVNTNTLPAVKPTVETKINPVVNNTKIDGLKDPLSVIEGISVGNVPKKEAFKVNYSKMDEPNIDKVDSAEINIKEPNNTIAEDFDVTAKPKQSIVTGTNKGKTSIKDKWETAYSRIVDVKKPIDKVSNEAFVKATNSANSGSVVESVLKNHLSDAKGNKIGDSLQKTLEDNIPKGEEVDFWEYALQRHNVARAGQEKPIYYKDKDVAYSPAESQARAEYLEKLHPEWKEKADNISGWLDSFMKEWGVKAGTIDEKAYNEMRELYPNYIPSNRGFNDLEDFLPGGSGNSKSFVDQSTPINSATGSQRDIVDPTESIMNLVNRTIRTAKYNEVGQDVVKAVKENPAMSKLAEILPPPKPFEHNPYATRDNVVTVLDGGKPVYLQINDKNLLGALTSINKLDLHDGAKAIKAINTAFKALITTKNPVFAIRNVMRDIPTYLINSKENNPFKLVGNLGGAVKDIATNSPTYQQYKALGGGGSNFLKSDATKSATELTGRVPILDAEGKVTGYRNISTGKKILNAIGGGIEKLNSVTESAPRLAEFKNSLGRGENLDKAMYDAAEVTTNFSRGGDLTKFFDVFTPYLNASVQGLDKLGRQVIKSPVQTALKGATVVTLPVLAMNYYNKDNPNFKDLDNRTKDNNILIPNVFGEKDEKGNAKTFIKIPKSREYGVLFGSLAERYLRQQDGEQNAFKDFGTTLRNNIGPANPLESNLFGPAINIAVGGNKDFAGRDIVPRAMTEDGRSKYLQYDEKTSEITKKIAELASKQGIDLSPKQMDYLIRSYLGVIAQLGLPLTTKNTMQGGNTTEKAFKPLTTQFIADPAYSNQGVTDFYDMLDKSKQLAADRNIIEKVDSKTVTTQEQTRNALNKVSTEMSALNKQIKEAEAKGDKNLVTKLRLKMLQLSKEANAKYNVK